MLSKHPLRLLLLTTSLLATMLPALAEYHWNPFDNMSEAEAESFFYWFLLIGFLALLLAFVVYPVLIGWLTYLVLRRTHPAPNIRLRPLLLYACLATVVSPFIVYLVTFLVPVYHLGQVLGLVAPAAGAAFSYFQQLKKAAALPPEPAADALPDAPPPGPDGY